MRPTARYLRKHLRYDEATGLLFWKLPERGRRLDRPAGRQAKNRYVTIGIDHKQYAAHHLAWVIMTGRWPVNEIDHRNRNMVDNRWTNLREATVSQNRANASLRDDNTSGARGVSWHFPRRKWRARVYIDGKEKHLGLFFTLEEAQTAYAVASKKHYGEFAHAPTKGDWA